MEFYKSSKYINMSTTKNFIEKCEQLKNDCNEWLVEDEIEGTVRWKCMFCTNALVKITFGWNPIKKDINWVYPYQHSKFGLLNKEVIQHVKSSKHKKVTPSEGNVIQC